jgi:hypothetical protein
MTEARESKNQKHRKSLHRYESKMELAIVERKFQPYKGELDINCSDKRTSFTADMFV